MKNDVFSGEEMAKESSFVERERKKKKRGNGGGKEADKG